MKHPPSAFRIDLSLEIVSGFHVTGAGEPMALVDRTQLAYAASTPDWLGPLGAGVGATGGGEAGDSAGGDDGGGRAGGRSRRVPVIPGSSLRGVTRMTLERLARTAGIAVCESPQPDRMCPRFSQASQDAATQAGEPFCLACRIFGSPWRESTVYFSNLMAHDAGVATRTSVAISRRLGTAEPGRLYTTEVTISAPQDRVYLRGHVEGYLSEPDLQWLVGALRALTHLGADRSRGLGSIVDGSVRLEVRRFRDGKWAPV